MVKIELRDGDSVELHAETPSGPLFLLVQSYASEVRIFSMSSKGKWGRTKTFKVKEK